MKIVETAKDFKRLRQSWKGTTGFVPTMGALHRGHISLIEIAKQSCAHVSVSIFVNPTQFNDAKDLQSYPRPLADDLKQLESSGVDAVFLPQPKEIYQDGYLFEVTEKAMSKVLCGGKRPGHFNGVLTVVLKLLNIVQPQKAFFGEKDYQQLRLIQDMAKALFLEAEIVGCPTVRELDGLAMSSRNVLLNKEQRHLAPRLQQILISAESPERAAEQLTREGFKVDYVEEHWGRRFAAAFLGSVRLIDNVSL